jgi:hypothetical protein
MEKYGTQKTILLWPMLIPCWMTRATYTHSEMSHFLLHGNKCYKKAAQC